MYMQMNLWKNVLIMNDCPFYLKTTCITMFVFSIRKTLLLKTNIQLKIYLMQCSKQNFFILIATTQNTIFQWNLNAG